MTDLELKNARIAYKMQLEGKRKLLESLANIPIQEFTKQFYPNIKAESILSISDDEILRRTFLRTFQDTKDSMQLMVYLNKVVRNNGTISDAFPYFESIIWDNSIKCDLLGEKIYTLFCDLETNNPILIPNYSLNEFLTNIYSIKLSNKPISETYYYNSKSLDKINKGSIEESYNRLQLYYFKELLISSREEAVEKVKILTKNQRL